MNSTAGDAESYRKLDETLKAHRGDTEAWGRLGELLRIQRQMLDRRYANRRVFADERGLNYKAVYDIERARTGGRSDFTLDSVLTLAEGYGVTPRSFGAALEGGELEPLASPQFSAISADRALPTITAILTSPGIGRYLAVVKAERAGGFPPRDEDEAQIWTTPMLREDEKAALIAGMRRNEDEAISAITAPQEPTGLA